MPKAGSGSRSKAPASRLPPHWRDFASFRHVPGEAASLSYPRVRRSRSTRECRLGCDRRRRRDRIDPATGAIDAACAANRHQPAYLTAVLPEAAIASGSATATVSRFIRSPAARPGISGRLDAARCAAAARLCLEPHARRDATCGPPLSEVVSHCSRRSRRVSCAASCLAKTLGDPDIVALALDAVGQPWIATATGVERLDADAAASFRLRAFRTKTSMRSALPSTDR